MWNTYIHNEVLLIHKKDKILPFETTWVDLEDTVLDRTWRYYAKWSKSDGERQILYDFTRMCTIINKQRHKQTKQKQAQGYSEQSSGY